jgi:hypothetical protein
MNDTVSKWLQRWGSQLQRKMLHAILNPIADRYSTQALRSAGLVIKGAGEGVAKIGATDFYAVVQGVLVKIAASTDMPALVGTVAADAFNVYCFYVDKAGTTTSAMGTAGASLAAVKFPPLPEGKALIGFIIINPTGTGDFVGGTTDLDDATVVPNAVYVSPTGPFDPTVLL